VGRATYSDGMMPPKNASVSANDAGGSRGASCTMGVCASAERGELSRCCASTFGPGPSTADCSSVEDDRDADASVGVWIEPLLPEVEGSEISDVLMVPRLAFVGRELPGLRFGASKRLIFGSRNQVGLRVAFAWGPVVVGLEGGGHLGGPVALVVN